jgi:hypothetical protein
MPFTGTITAASLPPEAIIDTFVVASEVAQTSLTAQKGDHAVRTDLGETYVLREEPASVFANWELILVSAGMVFPVVDTLGLFKGSVDDTKLVRLEADGITTGTTRVLTAPDKDITLQGSVTGSIPVGQLPFGDAVGDLTSSSDLVFDPVASTLTVINDTSNPFLIPLFDAVWYDNGTTIGAPQFRCLRAGGTKASPADAVVGEVLGFFTWQGYNDGDWRLAGTLGNRVKSLPVNGVRGEYFVSVTDAAGTSGDRLTIDSDDMTSSVNLVLDTDHTLQFEGSTSGVLTLDVPAAVTSHTLIFPAAQGTVGQVLTNDGSGNLSWDTSTNFQVTSIGASDYSVLDTDQIILKTAAGNTITLQNAVGRTGQTHFIKRTTTGGTATTVNTAGGNIDNAATFPLGGLVSITVASDGTNWWII